MSDPLTNVLFHGVWDMDHLSLPFDPEGQVEAWMELTAGTLAAGLSAGPLHGNQTATEEGLFVKDLGETGTSPSFGIGELASGTHRDHLL